MPNQVTINLYDETGQLRSWRDIEREVIKHAIADLKSMTLVAKRLGIGRSTLYRKMGEYGEAESPGGE